MTLVAPAAAQITGGDRRALARAATLVENRAADELLAELFAYTGRAKLTLGVTGAPGAGKSTLTNQLIRHFRGDTENKSVAVIAVDPTSPFSGGAILGDRIRMSNHYADPGVFIRSMASRGHLGGLAATTADLTTLFDAAGFDVILIETVGVGQDEVEIAKLAEVTLVLLTPSSGDDIQALKAGLMEIADVFVLNKADLPGADRLQQEIAGAVSLAHRADHWIPPIIPTVAEEGKGIAEVVAAARQYRNTGGRTGQAQAVWASRLREMLREKLMQQFPDKMFEEAAREVAGRRRDPYSIVEEWLAGAALRGPTTSRKG